MLHDAVTRLLSHGKMLTSHAHKSDHVSVTLNPNPTIPSHVFPKARDRDKGIDRETKGETERDRKRERQRQAERDIDKEREKERERQRGRQTDKQRERQTDRHREKGDRYRGKRQKERESCNILLDEHLVMCA